MVILFLIGVLMELTKKEIEHIAHLSRIEITETEKENFSSQLSDILNYVGQLDEVDTDMVEETARVGNLNNVLAKDEVCKSQITQKELLANAPDAHESYFKVKTVLE